MSLSLCGLLAGFILLRKSSVLVRLELPSRSRLGSVQSGNVFLSKSFFKDGARFQGVDDIFSLSIIEGIEKSAAKIEAEKNTAAQ